MFELRRSLSVSLFLQEFDNFKSFVEEELQTSMVSIRQSRRPAPIALTLRFGVT